MVFLGIGLVLLVMIVVELIDHQFDKRMTEINKPKELTQADAGMLGLSAQIEADLYTKKAFVFKDQLPKREDVLAALNSTHELNDWDESEGVFFDNIYDCTECAKEYQGDWHDCPACDDLSEPEEETKKPKKKKAKKKSKSKKKPKKKK